MPFLRATEASAGREVGTTRHTAAAKTTTRKAAPGPMPRVPREHGIG
jgi:hypothetical protein